MLRQGARKDCQGVVGGRADLWDFHRGSGRQAIDSGNAESDCFTCGFLNDLGLWTRLNWLVICMEHAARLGCGLVVVWENPQDVVSLPAFDELFSINRQAALDGGIGWIRTIHGEADKSALH